jgi:hypothetical protein
MYNVQSIVEETEIKFGFESAIFDRKVLKTFDLIFILISFFLLFNFLSLFCPLCFYLVHGTLYFVQKIS